MNTWFRLKHKKHFRFRIESKAIAQITTTFVSWGIRITTQGVSLDLMKMLRYDRNVKNFYCNWGRVPHFQHSTHEGFKPSLLRRNNREHIEDKPKHPIVLWVGVPYITYLTRWIVFFIILLRIVFVLFCFLRINYSFL